MKLAKKTQHLTDIPSILEFVWQESAKHALPGFRWTFERLADKTADPTRVRLKGLRVTGAKGRETKTVTLNLSDYDATDLYEYLNSKMTAAFESLN